MDNTWDYDSSLAALTAPGEAADFFRLANSYAPAALCAEMARLVYCSDLDRVDAALARVGFGGPSWFRAQGTDAFLAESADMAVLAFRGTEHPRFRRILDGSPIQSLMQGGLQNWQEAWQQVMEGAMPGMRDMFERLLEEGQDVLTDIDIVPDDWPQGGKVHRGFARAIDRVWQDVERRLDRLDKPVLYAGHSLGAALATLAASRRPPETLYTFGSPTVGDADFAATLADIVVYRYVNCCDIVCRLPPGLYDPLGRLRYIDSNGRLGETEESDSDRLQARVAHFKRMAGQWDKVWVRDLADHSAVNYVKALLANQ